MDTNSLLLKLTIGGLIMLSFLTLSNAIPINKKGNKYFGLFFLVWSSIWIGKMGFPESFIYNTYVYIFLRFIQFLLPLLVYLSVVFYTNPNYKYTKKDFKFLIIPCVFLVFISYETFIGINNYSRWYNILYIAHVLLYTILTIKRINEHQKNIELYASNKEPINLQWIIYIVCAIFGSTLLIILYSIYPAAIALNKYIHVIQIYWIAFFIVKQKEIFPKKLVKEEAIESLQNSESKKSKNTLFSDTELQSMKEKLLSLMEKEKPYLDSELNLVKLSEMLNISSHQLSYVLNNGVGRNFFHFVNSYRVNEAKALLSNPDYDNLTILAIGFQAGFNSKSSFNDAFKKMVNATPSQYKKNRPIL